MNAIRAFFAICLPPDVIQHVKTVLAALQQSSLQSTQMRWSAPENWHITLQFLKTVEMDVVPELVQCVRNELAKTSALLIQLGDLELFTSSSHSRIISLHVEPEKDLAEAARLIGKGIRAAKLPTEKRPFKGHMTLARSRDAVELPEVVVRPIPAFAATEVVLFQSKPGEHGSQYIPLSKIPLFRSS